ncbi:MAG: hypothetical protein FD137_710 [Spirochaetes bacterium]|nr:MAG: hypothetical protein FD137_710 [Spirochaetota bacterium]
MKVIVTGADGLLGSNLVRVLLEQGHSVRVFLQEGKASPTLEGLALEQSHGDILDPVSLRKAFAGQEAVIHAAANTSIWPAKSEAVRRVNRGGTQAVLDAAMKAGLGRFVYIGTANSFNPGSKEKPGTEDSAYTAWKYGLDYMDSKYEAQNLVLAAAKEKGFPALTVNPTFMLGPYDATPSSGAMLIRLYQGKIFGYTKGGKCWTHVRDVAVAAANALIAGNVGQSYIAGNQNLDYEEFFSMASKVMGISPPRIKIPRPLALAVGFGQSAMAAVNGSTPLLSYTAARIGCESFYYDPAKARKELSMPFTPIETAVLESFLWLQDHGYLEKSL